MITNLHFWVSGTPAPQGSKQGFIRGGRVAMVEASKKVAPWRQDVVAAAAKAMEQQQWQAPAAVEASIVFYFRRPASHYRTGKNAHLLRDGAPDHVMTKPDLDKLLRSTFDALTTVAAIADDCRVVAVRAEKQYANRNDPIGAAINLTALPNKGEARD